MAISTPYKSNTVASVSGTTFNSNGSPFASGDVGRLIILTGGPGKLQHRKIVSFVDSNTVELDHSWDANAWLDTVDDVLPSSGDAWCMSYLQTDSAFTGESGVVIAGEQIDISSLNLSNRAYVHIVNAQVDAASAGIDIGVSAGIIFGWYQYVLNEDAQVRDSCHIIDRSSGTRGNQWGRGSSPGGDFGMLDIYGGMVTVDHGGSVNFWRTYYDDDSSDCQCRWINVQCFGSPGLGSRVDGDRSIIVVEQVGARTTVGVCNPRTAVSRVSISSIDCDQAGYVWLSVSGGGPSGRLVFPRLNNIRDRVIRCHRTYHSGTNVMEVIAKKSEIDAAPVFIDVSATPSGTHTFRYGNLVRPSFIDSSNTIITTAIKTRLYDAPGSFIVENTVTDGSFPERFVRHTDIPTVAGDRNLSDGTQYAPYSLRAVQYGKLFTTSTIDVEDTFEPNIVMLDDVNITEPSKAVVDAYTNIDGNGDALYDRAVSWLQDNIVDETGFIVEKTSQGLDFGGYVVRITGSGDLFNASGNIVTVNSSLTANLISTQNVVDARSPRTVSYSVNNDLVIEDASAPWTLDGSTVGNIINNDASNNLVVNLINGATATTSEQGTNNGQVSIITPVSINFTVLDAQTSAPIQGARIYIEANSGGNLSAGTVIINDTTNSAGEVTVTFNYDGDQPVTGRCRKGSSSPFYKTAQISSTITLSGLRDTIFLIGD